MVAKLKIEMSAFSRTYVRSRADYLYRGFQFTQKLEGMFTDMKISEESVVSFRNYLNRNGVGFEKYIPGGLVLMAI
jgi:hypothetical protein